MRGSPTGFGVKPRPQAPRSVGVGRRGHRQPLRSPAGLAGLPGANPAARFVSGESVILDAASRRGVLVHLME